MILIPKLSNYYSTKMGVGQQLIAYWTGMCTSLYSSGSCQKTLDRNTDEFGDVRIVSHGLPLGATPFLSFNTRTRPVNKQHFHGSIRTIPLRVCTGLTRNHHHDSEGRRARGREEDSPHYLRQVFPSLMLSQLPQETRGTKTFLI